MQNKFLKRKGLAKPKRFGNPFLRKRPLAPCKDWRLVLQGGPFSGRSLFVQKFVNPATTTFSIVVEGDRWKGYYNGDGNWVNVN